MTFSPPFQRPFSATFDRRAAAAAAGPWYRAGGAPAPIAVYQPKGAADLAASYVNLVTPGTYNAAPGTAPDFDAATGWGFKSDGQYLDTGVVPASGYAILVAFSGSTVSTGDVYLAGAYSSSGNEFWVTHYFVGTGCNYASGSRLGAVAPTLTDGVLGIAGNTAYRDGVAESGSTTGSFTISQSVFIGGMNIGGSLYLNTPSADYKAVVIWDTSTGHATWMPAVSAAVALI